MIRSMILIFAVAVLAAASAVAQIPDEFTNLEVLPKDIGKRELIDAMRSFSTGLGVRCEYCHEQKTPGDFNSIDWASDAEPAKEKARGMMKLVKKINDEALPAAIAEPKARVSCVTCHRGLTDPRTLDAVLLEAIDENGADAGIERYRELRDRYYGSGSYDFGAQVMLEVATSVAQTGGDAEGAMKLLELNAEFHPDHSYTYLAMSQVQAMGGDTAGAIANAQKALELDPENRNAQRMLDQLKGAAEGQ